MVLVHLIKRKFFTYIRPQIKAVELLLNYYKNYPLTKS